MPRRSIVKIGVVAGEASGDYLGARLIDSIKTRRPDAVVTGICGPRMAALGAVSMFPMESISVMGLDDLATRLLSIIKTRRQLAEHFVNNPPDVFVGIDVPDFNLGLETRLRRHGIRTVHYVSPTVWAWRSYRIRKIQRAVGHMLTLFPFEAEFYRKYQVPVTFVGHPIADEIDPNVDVSSLRKRFGVSARQLVALLPGSRQSELHALGTLFIDVANALREQNRDVEFIAPFADDETKAFFSKLLRKQRRDLPIQVVKGMSRQVIAASDVALLASGTAALEAALFAKPMVVAYRVSWLTGILVKMFAHVRYFSMPNNLLERPVVPEFMQREATSANLTAAVARFLDDATLRTEVSSQLAAIYDMLRKNASDRAADVILGIAR